MNRLAFVVLLCLLALPIAPAAAARPAPFTIFAAASLTNVLTDIATDWVAATHHPMPRFSFDSSGRLARQINEGAPADLFFSADLEWMDYAANNKLIDPSTRENLLGNTLVCVVPATSTLAIRMAGDLAKPTVEHLALAGESVPAGKYAQAALEHEGVWTDVQSKLVRGDNVRATLAYVATGEVDAGIVYGTDALVEPRVKLAFTFPRASHPPIVYPVAMIDGSLNASLAREFLAYLRTAPALQRFIDAGFTILPLPGEEPQGSL